MSNNTPVLMAAAAASTAKASDSAALDQAFAQLRTYQPGSARRLLVPIDEAVVTSLKTPGLRNELEQRLSALLREPLPVVAKEYICRKLALIGSAASVSALAQLLDDKDLAEPARAALEAMPCRESLDALRGALKKTTGSVRAGVIRSLGARRDAQSALELIPVLASSDAQQAVAAATALGEIATLEAASALAKAHATAPEPVAHKIADARLICAERMLTSGQKEQALAIYKALAQSGQPKPVQLAAKRGLLLSMQGQ